jgi:hypothetical protein
MKYILQNRFPPFILITAVTIATGAWVSAQDRPQSSKPTTRPAAEKKDDLEPDIEPPREPSPEEILKELSKQSDAAPRPVIPPSRPGQTVRKTVDASALPPNTIVPPTPKLFPDGYRIVDRPGRLTREGDYYTFTFESRGQGTPELPMRLLPNRLLEDMEIVSEGGTKSVVFLVSGELTEYHGVNYLLLQKLLTRPNLGNLK